MFDEQDRQYFYNEFKNNGYEVGSYDDFKKDLNNEEDRNWYYNEAKNMGYDVGTQADFDKMVLEPAPSTSGGGKQVDASATTQSVEQKASTETKPQVAQPAKKQETTDKEPGLIAKVLDMIPTGVQTSNGTYQPSPEIPLPVVKGEEMPVKEETSSSSSANAASPESKEAAPITTPTGVVNNEGLMDAKLANYLENWKQRPDKQSTYFENLVADLLADGTANSNEEAVNMVMPALHRYANRSAMDVTNQVVSSLPDDTVQDAEKSIESQWYSHGVQDKLKQEAYNMGISYDDYVGLFLKPAMVQSLVNKYGPNYRDIAEGIATRLYSHDENVQDRLMNQDINDALSSVISKYVNPSVVDEYNKAQEAGSKAFTEGMEGSQFIPANLRLGTALGAQYEANEAKDPAKVLSSLQKKFGRLYRNPEFLNDMSNAAFKVMQRYGLNGTQSSDPKQFKPMINSVLKNELDQLEIKGMMPKGSAEYIMKTGLGNTIVGKITRKAVQTDYQNWLEDIANQQYQPGFWENVASGALTFAGDAWSYWLPGAAGGKLTKSMVAKAEGKLAGDLMAKGMERKMAERAAKVLIGKSKAAALKSGAAHGAVTFGGQSAISKPIDEIYRTGQFDENGKIYNPSVGKVIANTLGEVAKQSAVGAIMQGGTIANMVGKGRGLATNILADIGGKVVDSGIMTGQQLLERMAHDPNFKPTGKDAVETFLESGANLLSIGFPGFVGKYARFKDAREFNKKFDFSDQDIAELKRFGYDVLRDAFEKVGIGEYAVVGENAQRLDGQLTQKYMDLMNDKSVPEVLKAKMMAVVEGKRPSSFSPIVDSIIVQPMDNDGKVYLETLNKDGGVVDRKEYSSLDEAQKADKKLEYEKTLGLASVLEGEFHNEFTQEHLDGLYNKAAQKYNMGEKLTDEDKAAVYLHQNAGAIKEIMDKQQKGIILTDEEQKQVNAYRHYYDSALENSSVMREFVNTFEDSHGVARGTLRKALESKDKKYAPLVESYLKELYNSIELKREMKQIEDDRKRLEQGDVDGAKPAAPVEGPASVEGSAGGQEPPVSEEPAPYQDRTNSVSTPSDAEVAANPANSAAEGAGYEPKVASSDAFVMGQNAYKNGDSEALQAIDYNSDLATGRLKRAFADNEKMPDIVANAYNEGRDMEQFVAQRAGSLTPAQKEAISKYVEAMDSKKGAIDALQHADDGYGDALKEQLWPYQTEDGNIVPATLDSGKQVFLKKANEYGGAFVVVPDEQGQPTIKQVSNAEIKEVGTPVSLDEYIENTVAQQKDARAQQFISQFDGSGLKPNDQVTVAMEEGDANVNMTFAGYSEDGKIVLTDGKDYLPLSKEEFAAWRKNALDNAINQHLDAEDVEREQAQIKKAEADKQERYKKGIFGYAAGKPDYSDTQTDPKVAAEYLQKTTGEDRKALFANIVAEKQALQKRISQLREHIANNEEWLSLNADLDPENAETRSLANKQMQGQIVDLQARFDQWNKIRSAVMTPEEAEAIKADRTKKIAEAGVNDVDVAPVEGREIAVLSDEELKKQYPTMDEASSYITSERKKIYRIQSDEVQREIDGVDEVLDRYVNGEIDLEPEQLKELNTTKDQLQARQQNLTESAKDLKAQADKLKTLYRKENMEARAKAVENMTPAEQRAVKVENAIKNGNLSQLNSIYEEVRGATDFTDTEPNTIEEYVANNIGRFSLNYEGKDKAGVLSNGIKQETGLGRKDFDKLQILAKEGEGKTVPEFVHSLYDNMPEQLKQMGYSDQDIRDAFLNLISSVENYSDLKNYTLNNKVAEAEQQLRTLEHQEEEMMEKATSYEINDETAPFADRLETAISETETNPTDAQKKAGNYKKGHLSFGGYDFTVETPKGVTRSGKDEQGKPWSVTMHDTYGYILGKIGVDGDHIDMFINDAADLDTFDGNVYVVDQVNPETGEFDEHKVMYGYPDEAAATKAYLSNYSKGWKGLGKVTSVPKATFDKWLESSDRKTKPFRDYAMIQHEEAKKAKQANEALPFDAPMSMDDLPFHRDVKEVKPENLTEAQKVAYEAVSTMLKKAGIPVKVVSNEDMEKVAEAQDNMAVEMLLNDPRLRFYIKTPEQKEAAKAAYDWAAKNRPDKFKQYAIVNMDNPNEPPQYFEKKDLAEKWRKYYTNAWKIGNYKAFNLNKPFEEQIKDVKGDVPSEFDPYKAESLLNKRIELEKQIKETEDSYNAKKKERAEYQNQLMQDYMDQHGLSSENDIPDDVWTDYRDKSFEKYQDTLDDLFHKYVELDNQLKAVAEPGVQYLKGKGVVYGYTDGKEIVLNQEYLNPNTPIHEYQHLWRTAAKEMNPELIEHGDKLIMQTQLFADLKQDPNYNHLTDEQICDEAFARLTGEDGAAILEQMAKDAIKENPLDTAKELSVINKLKEWLKKFWYWTLDTFTKWKPEDIKRMTLEDIRNLVLRDLANGVDPRTKIHEAENADDIKFMGSTTKKRMKDISTQLEGRELDEAQQAVADVYSGKKDNVSLTVEREDGSNKIIMRQGNDNHAGTKHSVFRHYGVKANSLNVDDLLLIPTVLKEGERKVSDNGRVAYVYVDPTSQVKYTVVTEPKNNKEFFNDFYSNKKANPSETSRVVENSTNTPEGAHNNDVNAFMRAKVNNNSETAKGNDGNLSVEDKIKAVSQQFGVDQADVAMYANAIKKGSTAEAARARANIKRHLLQANEDKISSFKELLKYTVPVNEALKENFGDVDAMIEERKQQMEAQRNAMEAARKRAEEEEAKRQKHLEELSVIPDDQLDKQYMDALAKGDDATAREMLDEAARRKGYDDTESAYQGVGAWAAPGNPGYESDKARRDDWESSGSDVNLEDIALGYTPQPDDYFSHPERYSQNTPHGLESVKAINTAIDAIKNGEKDVKVKVYRAVPTSVKEGKLRNGDWVTPSKKYAEMHGTNRLDGKYRIIEDEVPATQLWWDGNDANEFGFDDGKEYKYKNAKNNRKLNDLVTYDDEGDVIPPSKRFNSRKSDIRFMFGGEKGAAEADKAEEQTIRMDNLDVAKQMEEAKKDAKIIKMATGWEKGVDGKWRYEMPDAKIKDTMDVGGGHIVKRYEDDMLWNGGKLSKVIDAPELFKAYPQLKDVRIETDAIMNDMPSNGEYNPQTKTITIHADELKYLNSILNHEIQHVIQREEGFAHGGTPEQVERDFNAAKAEWKARSYAFELEEKAKEMGGEYNQSAVEKALIQEYKDMDMPEFIPDKETRIKGFNYFARGYADRSMDDAIKRFRLDRFQRTDFDSYQEYRKLAGEVEARNVEKRLGMTDEERRNSLASETEDVNRDEQIVMNGNDASYSIVKDPETIKKLDKEDTVKVYRAMQVGEDGKLYPPMAAKVKGKFVEPIELGKWEQADERPELADDKGMFTLNKGNGKSLKAAYNPYLHTSRTPLNDQFSEAQNRPNIVTVEVEVPKSELTSGYKADKAKDAVGEVEWKAGIIQGQLTGKRKVVLSRWDKPVRIVPDSEVADVIVNNMFKGKNITMPSNVVTPSLRKELEKRGVPFVETDNRGRIVGGENDGVHYSKVYGKNAQSPVLEQKLKKHPDSLMKAGTYFSGGGLVEEGLKGIIDPVVAVEYDRKISGVYRNNFGQHIVTADVRDVDPKELVKHIDGEVEYFHASPVCKNYSQAKSNSGEVELDKETAKSTADFIDAVKPRVVTIENVKGYKDSEAMNIITKSLDKNGYTWDSDVYNAADYGGYTSRERLIIRAVKDGELPKKPKKQPRKGGWLEAVEDILPTLTVKESGVAPWMDARLKADGIDWQKVEKPLYVMGSAYADGKIPHAYGDEILPTLRTKSGDVIIMPGGKVLRADGRVLARISGLGDDYKLPKTESLAHTIIGNGIPVQLTQGVIAPLLNKDDLSGRNVLARLGSSIFKNNWDADKQKQVSDRVVNTANKLGGAEATVYTSVDEVPDAYLSDVKNGATGWYDPTTHTVHVYLPNCADANEAERTVLHEKIGHEGMEVLLGGEDGVRKFANFVYRSVGKDVRGKIIDFANKYDPDWKNPDRMNVGTQEYIAHLAEEGPKTAEDLSLWTKIKHYLIKLLKKLGVRVPGLLNDKDLRYYLMKAGKALHVWDEMPQEKQEAMMKQASNAEIKDALSDGAGKGKPRQKKGESTIQYMKRVQEWRKWQNAREDKENPEPPMFYDIDKDEAGKKEWAQLNKDWRERHHLVGEEPTGMPIRMENEEDDAYMNRIHEYEKWQAAMKNQEDPLPDMFAFEKKKQEEVKRKYEDWLAKHDLLEQQQADLDLYEGKIYPAETNPKADALEQQVMQDLAEVTSTDVSKEGAAMTVKHAVIHRRKNMEEASADDAIYINDVKNRIEKMADSGVFDKLLSDYKGKKNRAEKLAETIPYIIEAPRRLRDMAHNLNATGVFDKGHIHIQPADVEAIQPYVTDLITETAKKHTEIKKGKEIEVYDDPKAVSEVASKMAQAINANHQGEEGFVPCDGTDILSKHVLKLVKERVVPGRINYKELSPEMQAAIDSIRDWYNYTYDWLMDNHTLKAGTGYNVDYVNHIWDKEKSDPNAYATFVENRQRTKSPNEKKRTISTLMEGIYAGLVPKTTDITKMMAYYSRSNIEAWANKTMLQELTGLNVIERNEKGEVISTDPLLSSSAPFNLEQYKYFEIPGVGPVWVYNVSPKQVKVKNPITDNEKVIYSEASAGDRFGVVFDTYQSSPFWKTFDTFASSAKKLELGFSGFHAGALTEVYMVQNMVEFGPKKAMANFMKYIFVDTAKNHELPCFANPEDFQEAASHLVKFGATNDYAAADVQNMFDNMRDAMMKVQEKLKDGNKISGTVAKASMPLTVVTQMLSLINKGMDRALWDFLHDGLKLATYRMRADKTKELAKKKGWSAEELNRALDEDGQFVNDMFGGQHWDVLGASHRTLRYAGRVLLSPDWNASTTRHFLALTGFGSIWNEATFENFKQYYKRLKHKELTPEDEGRRSRQISALLCYGIGFMVFYEGIANGINAAFRALDEEKERKKAEEIRKTNPSYKSMYELAYGDEGMKWYDYLMRGNSLGQQSKIFLGRYEDGTEMYVRHGKQFREVPEYLFNHKGELEFPGPMVQRMIGKANPMVRMTLDDINYLSDFQASHADQDIQRKYGKTIGLLYKDALYWAPFLIPSQENKEFKAVDFFFPSSKGFSPWKAQSYFKDFILSGDMEGVVMTYQSCQRNGIDPEAQIKAAIGSVKALESAEMSDGVTSLQEASKRFDAAKSITEKKKMRQKMKKFLSQSDYKAFTQKEALDMVQGYLNGDEDLKEMEKAESKYLMKAKAEDVTEDWRIQNVWNGTMETYQEYQRLKDVDKAKANAFKNSKTNKRLFAARKAISAARRKMNKAKKQMDGTNDAAKLVEIRNTRKELLKTLNGME
jgi:site-specific DNA-cytosine methylase